MYSEKKLSDVLCEDYIIFKYFQFIRAQFKNFAQGPKILETTLSEPWLTRPSWVRFSLLITLPKLIIHSLGLSKRDWNYLKYVYFDKFAHISLHPYKFSTRPPHKKLK